MTVVTVDILYIYFSVLACCLHVCLKSISCQNHVFQHSLCLLGKSKWYPRKCLFHRCLRFKPRCLICGLNYHKQTDSCLFRLLTKWPSKILPHVFSIIYQKKKVCLSFVSCIGNRVNSDWLGHLFPVISMAKSVPITLNSPYLCLQLFAFTKIGLMSWLY